MPSIKKETKSGFGRKKRGAKKRGGGRPKKDASSLGDNVPSAHVEPSPEKVSLYMYLRKIYKPPIIL